MTAIKNHLEHHRAHMLVCASGAAILVVGLALSVEVVAIVGAVICAAGCLSMIWMMISAARSERGAVA